MPSVTIEPTAVVSMSNWEANTGAGQEEEVVTDSNDGTFMVVNDLDNGGDVRYTHSDTGVPRDFRTLAVVESLVVRYEVDMGQTYLARKWNGAGSPSSGSSFNRGSEQWAQETHDWVSTTPTIGDCDDSGWGWSATWVSNVPKVSKLSVAITYAVPAGDQPYLVGQWVGPIVALGVEALDKLGAFIRGVKGHAYTREELLTLWRELRECRHPRVFDLGARACS